MSDEVLVVGSANADLVVATDRRPAGGETVLGGDTEISPGGKGANTAVAAARLGAAVGLLAAVGDDAYGAMLQDSLRGAGVRVGAVRVLDRPTGIAYITVTPDGENSILVSPGANSALQLSDVDAEVRDAGVVVASMEIPLPTVEHAVATAAGAGVHTVLNLSPAATVSSRTLAALDVLLVNEHEAGWLLDCVPAEVDPARLRTLGPRAAVVTLGADGVLVATEETTTEITAPAVHAVDTTGAGDGFAGALAAGLAEGNTLVAAARQATHAAAISVTLRGAQPSYPTAGQLT